MKKLIATSIALLFMTLALWRCGQTSHVDHRTSDSNDANGEEAAATDSDMRDFMLLSNPTSTTAATKPCASRVGGIPDPNQGSGMCTGNLLLTIPLPTVGGMLAHNSLAATVDNGFGAGWDVSFRSKVDLSSDKLTLTLTFGDGTALTFKAATADGPWASSEPRLSRGVFTLVGNDLVQTDVGGTTMHYTGLTDGHFVIASIRAANGQTTTVSRTATTETWASSFGTKITFTSAAGHVVGVTDATGGQYTLNYANGHLTSVKNPDGSAWTVLYAGDFIGALRSPTGEFTQYAYWKNGELRATVDWLNFTTNFSYSATTVTAQSAAGNVVETFNGSGGIISSNENHMQTQWTRDSSNRPTSVTDPFGRTTQFAYTDAGPFPTSVTDASGTTLTYTYSNNDVTQVVESFGGKSITTSFAYDPAHRLTRVTINGVPVDFSFDAKGNPTGVSVNNTPPLMTVTYDANGLPTTVVDASNLTTTRSYLSDGNISGITDPLGRATGLQYNAKGQVSGASYPDSTLQITGYDSFGRMNQIQNLGMSGTSTTSRTDIGFPGTGFTVTSKTSINGQDMPTEVEKFDPAGELQSVEESTAGGGSSLALSGSVAGTVAGAVANGVMTIFGADGCKCQKPKNIAAKGQAPVASPAATAGPTCPSANSVTLSPSGGNADSNTSVTIQGNGFASGSQVSIADSSVAATSTGSGLSVKVPPGPKGVFGANPVPITIKIPGCPDITKIFTYTRSGNTVPNSPGTTTTGGNGKTPPSSGGCPPGQTFQPDGTGSADWTCK